MKIAISAAAPTLDAQIDPRFGRCQCFIIVDPETLAFEAVENSSAMASGGAGIAAAQMVAGKGVKAVLTGNCGPNAYQVLTSAGIKIFTGVYGTVNDAIVTYKSGQLQTASQPTVRAHSGMGSGRGFSKGAAFSQTPPAGTGIDTLRAETSQLKEKLNDIQSRLETLEKKNK